MIEHFRAYLRSNRSESTAQKYAQAAEKLLLFCAQQRLPLESLPPGIITIFAEYLRANGLASSSVHTMAYGAKKFLSWLRARGIIKGDEFTDPDLPRITHELPNVPTTDDLVAFLSATAVQEEPQRTAILLLPFCGLRSNELTKLELSAISKVNAPNNEGGTTAHLCLTVTSETAKGGVRRVVPLLPDGNRILMSYLQTWRRAQPNGSTWLFPMPDGGPISNRTLRHYVQRIR